MRIFRRWFASRRIGVLMGGDSAERTISLKTGTAILKSLQRQGFQAYGIDARTDLPAKLRTQRINIAYLALHGPGGEDGSVQGLLEWMKIPYTGSGVMASACAMNKMAAKQLFDTAGLRTPDWCVIREGTVSHASVRMQRLGYPVVVKPACQGSAVGISIVRSSRAFPAALQKAFRYGSDVLVERYLKGPEITVGFLGGKTLPIIEIVPASRPFYDFHAKYAPGGSVHLLPARISARAARRAHALALAACAVLQVRAVARVDLIVDRGDRPSLLEVNTIPGMTETSLLPEAARAAGMNFDTLVLKIAEYSFGTL